MTEQQVFCENQCVNNTGFCCGRSCDCDCHEAWEMCPRCHGDGRIDADPLNDHTHEIVECRMCEGLGIKEKQGFEVMIP